MKKQDILDMLNTLPDDEEIPHYFMNYYLLQSIPVVAVEMEDIERLGYDTSKLSYQEMRNIADYMEEIGAEWLYSGGGWFEDALEETLEEFEIPKKYDPTDDEDDEDDDMVSELGLS